MAYRFGHFADVHHPKPTTSDVVTDLDILLNSKNSERIIWGGDQVVGDEPNVPHTPENQITTFWEDIVEQVSGAIDASYAIGGNHDVPYTYWNKISRQYIGDRVGTPQVMRPVDGVTICLINTQGAAAVQGGGDSIAQNNCYVPYHELEWLNEQLSAADDRNDIKIVIGHAPVWFSTDSNHYTYNPDAPWGDKNFGYMRNTNAYDIVSNFNMCRRVLESNGPVVYLSGHEYQADSEIFRDISNNSDPVYHVWQNHYGQFSNGSTAFVDADTVTGNVKFVSVEKSTGNETTVMDVTPSW